MHSLPFWAGWGDVAFVLGSCGMGRNGISCGLVREGLWAWAAGGGEG